MEKIVLVTSNKESHQPLLRCLEILFPECIIELLSENKKDVPDNLQHQSN